MTSHLVIGDPHAKPNESLERFEWLGKAIVDILPDAVICLGDFTDFTSLSSYDKGKLSFEGQRVNADIEAAKKAQDAIFQPLWDLQKYQSKHLKKKMYVPELIMLGGNHDEGRIAKVVANNPELSDYLSIDDLEYEEYGWTYVPYRDYTVLDGIAYSHHFPSGVLGKAIGGINIGRSLIRRNLMSSTVGHAHVFDYAVETRVDGRKIHGLSAGCFTEDTPDYAIDTAKFWWRGLILKTGINDGDYALHQLSMDEVKASYA